MRTLLLTGFEPFGGEKTNPSLEAVKRLDGYVVGDIAVKAVELPVAWERVPSLLENALLEHSPTFVIAVGQAGGRAKIGVERIGINICHGKDNYDVARSGEPVIQGEADGYFSSLPIESLALAINKAGVPAYVSNTAGTYLCNFTLYTLEHLIRSRHLAISSCFIHIPYLPAQAAEKSEQQLPSMSLDSVVTGLRAVVDYLAQLAPEVHP